MKWQSVRRGFEQLRPRVFLQHPIFRDAISVSVLVASLIINLITVAVLIAKLHKVDYPVPVHYLSLVGFDQVGAWYENYRFAVFGLVVTAINGMLAVKSFQRNRLLSFFLLIGAVVVAILCLVISTAFAVIV